MKRFGPVAIAIFANLSISCSVEDSTERQNTRSQYDAASSKTGDSALSTQDNTANKVAVAKIGNSKSRGNTDSFSSPPGEKSGFFPSSANQDKDSTDALWGVSGTSEDDPAIIGSSILFPADESTILQGSALPAQNSTFTARNNLVIASYYYCLGRYVDAEGLIYWANELGSGNLTPDQLKDAICSSLEGQIAEFYFRYLYRDPDAAGMAYWIDDIEVRGQSLASVETNIRNSSEAAAAATRLRRVGYEALRTSRLNLFNQRKDELETAYIAEAVEAGYFLCLGRASDPDGKAYWVNQVKSGILQVEAISAALCESDEGKIANLYFSILNRDPDAAGMQYWIDQLELGLSLEQMEQFFRDSTEGKSAEVGARKAAFESIQSSRLGFYNASISKL